MECNGNAALTDKRRMLIFFNLVVSGIATSILSTAMTTALPSLVMYFGVSTTTGQWVTSGYSLAMGIAADGISDYPIPYQKIVYGRDRVLYCGNPVQYLFREFCRDDGWKSPAGMRQWRFNVGGTGDHSYGLSIGEEGNDDGDLWSCHNGSAHYCAYGSRVNDRCLWMEIYFLSGYGHFGGILPNLRYCF